MKRLDPLSQPVATLVKPFIVQDLKGTETEQIKLLKYCKKEMDFDKPTYQYLHAKREVLQVEIRCVRVDGYLDSSRGLAEDLVDAQTYNHGFNLNRDPKDAP